MVWDEVGDNCFRRRYRSFDLNIGVVRGSDGLLVVDTRADLRQADELLDELRVFDRPVRWVVNSHWHFDHTFGNQRFVEHARRENDAAAATRVSPDLELWGHVELPAKLLADEPGLKASLRARYGGDAGDEYDRVTLTPPDHLVETRHVLDVGDRGVELAHLGRGHTGNDLALTVLSSGVVFAGDLLEQSGPPAYGDDCFPLEWPATVRELTRLAPSTVIPGHGDVMTATDAADQVDDITVVAELIRELHATGVAVDDALLEAGDRWPFPVAQLGHAVRRGYAALDRR